MASITYVYAREILDSRGIPTVECSIWLDNNQMVTSSVPGGTAKGKYEALELRDNDPQRMNGNGVLQAVANVNNIIGPQLIGQDPTQQTALDQYLLALDGTPNKTKLGANALIAVSQTLLKAGAASVGMPIYQYIRQLYQLTNELSMPAMVYTLINGGEQGADNLDIQEYEVIPATFHSYANSLNIAVTYSKKLSDVLASKGAVHSVGMVGGYAPNLYNNSDTFEILVETTKMTPYTFAQDLFLGVDMAAHAFFDGGKYVLKDKSQPYNSTELLDYYRQMKENYHVVYIEDPFQEDDIESWKKITEELGETTTIVGDSLLATNKERVKIAIAEKWCNAVLVKPNQIGTITETIEVIQLARAANWQVVVSHRSGETTDSLIADLAVGVGADYAKFGPPNRGERTVKLNRLLQIYAELASQAAVNSAAQAQTTQPSTQYVQQTNPTS